MVFIITLVALITATTILAVVLIYILYNIGRRSKEVEELRTVHKLPASQEIVYTDLKQNAEVLFSEKYKMMGKPDYIARIGDSYVPIELKNSDIQSPYPNQIMQLAAYCLILEDIGGKIPFGIIRDATGFEHKVEFTNELRKEVIRIANLIKKKNEHSRIKRNHNSPNKCRGCTVANFCNQKLI